MYWDFIRSDTHPTGLVFGLSSRPPFPKKLRVFTTRKHLFQPVSVHVLGSPHFRKERSSSPLR